MSELTNEQFENLLKQAVLVHLSDDELGQYLDGATDEVTSARIVAHLRQCQMCSGRSALMKLSAATNRESNEQSGSGV
jgi:predicted anti-sigma-YlaC factor YlaD